MKGHAWVAGVTLPLEDDREAEVYARFLTDRQPEHRRPLVTGVHVDVLDVFCERCRVRWEVAAEDECQALNLDGEILAHRKADIQARANAARHARKARGGRVGGPARLPKSDG